jgi:hypothetical protein
VEPDPLTTALSRLTPVAPAINRDSLMFGAGRASVESTVAVWKRTAAGLAAALVAVTVYSFVRPDPEPRVVVQERIVEKVVEVPVTVPPSPSREPNPVPVATAPLDPSSAFRLRQLGLTKGLDFLPPPRVPTASAFTAADYSDLLR